MVSLSKATYVPTPLSQIKQWLVGGYGAHVDKTQRVEKSQPDTTTCHRQAKCAAKLICNLLIPNFILSATCSSDSCVSLMGSFTGTVGNCKLIYLIFIVLFYFLPSAGVGVE